MLTNTSFFLLFSFLRTQIPTFFFPREALQIRGKQHTSEQGHTPRFFPSADIYMKKGCQKKKKEALLGIGNDS